MKLVRPFTPHALNVLLLPLTFLSHALHSNSSTWPDYSDCSPARPERFPICHDCSPTFPDISSTLPQSSPSPTYPDCSPTYPHCCQRMPYLISYPSPDCSRTLQRNLNLCFPRKGIARPQSQFPHSCVCERSRYSHVRPTYFPACRIGRPIRGIYKLLTETLM